MALDAPAFLPFLPGERVRIFATAEAARLADLLQDALHPRIGLVMQTLDTLEGAGWVQVLLDGGAGTEWIEDPAALRR
jgi:hypothetical protein